MLNLVVILLSILMFVDCVLLVALVLLQLPKKDAGAGISFGADTTTALFGAGSGNVLTKITKYVAIGFFALALILAMLSSRVGQNTAAATFVKALGQGSAPTPAPISQAAPATTPGGIATPTPAPKGSTTTPLLQLSNAPSPAVSTNH